MRNPRPFTVLQPIPGQSPKPLFTVYAYSLDQARALVAAKVAGETRRCTALLIDDTRRGAENGRTRFS